VREIGAVGGQEYYERDLWNRPVCSLKWDSEEVIEDEKLRKVIMEMTNWHVW